MVGVEWSVVDVRIAGNKINRDLSFVGSRDFQTSEPVAMGLTNVAHAQLWLTLGTLWRPMWRPPVGKRVSIYIGAYVIDFADLSSPASISKTIFQARYLQECLHRWVSQKSVPLRLSS